MAAAIEGALARILRVLALGAMMTSAGVDSVASTYRSLKRW